MNDTLSELKNEFVYYKRKNGCKYKTAKYHLDKYVEFSAHYAPEEWIPSRDTVNAFLRKHSHTPGNLYNIAATMREFSRYLIGTGYDGAYILPQRKVSLPVPAPPHLFTKDEIDCFFQSCDRIPYDHHVPHRHIVLPAMYRLFYCCGLRCKEARTLKRANVCLQGSHIDVIQSKGPKSRRIFLSQELSDYLKDYDLRMDLLLQDRTWFFPSRTDRPYSEGAFTDNFRKIWKDAFPDKKALGIKVRAYDFRHHFAYANMNRWLKEGKDINVMLPYLMRYMGHQEIENTLYYFHLVPDIYDAIIEKSSVFESLLPEVNGK